MTQLSLITAEELKTAIANMPALPTLVVELLANTDPDTIDVDYLAQRISRDPALTARTLRIANSPFYGLAGKVASIQSAIMILGFRAVRSLLISAAMVHSLNQVGRNNTWLRGLWRHSIGVALFARELAYIKRENMETAFTAGLLHNMGRIFLRANFAAQYEIAVTWQTAQGALLASAEKVVLGIDYATAGAFMGRQWSLPDVLIETIAHHFEPPAGQASSLAEIVHAANIFVHALELDHTPDMAVPKLAESAWSHLDLDWEALPALFAKIETHLDDAYQALTS